ncbi:MAG: SGNH/GDSL hydrolase family protein [Chloroflexi bacterium]|nr:SGNH/GDSL hydrolase family protein [Chloroflexota bacterium]
MTKYPQDLLMTNQALLILIIQFLVIIQLYLTVRLFARYAGGKWKSPAVLWIINIVFLAVFLILPEITLQGIYGDDLFRLSNVRIWHPDRIWTLPERETFEFRSVQKDFGAPWIMRLNSHGIRNKEVPCRPGELRVLIMGDSWVFGWGVDEQQAYPAVLEKLLRQKLNCPVHVINGGSPGYSSSQVFSLLKDLNGIYKPHLVILAAYGNELEGVVLARKNRFKFIQAITGLLSKSRLHMFIWRYIHRNNPADEVTASINEMTAITKDNEARMMEYCKENGILFELLSTKFQEGTEINNNIISFREPVGSPESGGYYKLWLKLPGSKYDMELDKVHPGPEGHMIIAGELLKFTTETGILNRAINKMKKETGR